MTRHTAVNFALALASGVMLVLLYPRFGYSFLAPFALSPLLAALAREQRWAPRFLLGYVAGVVFWAGVCYWIEGTLDRVGYAGSLSCGLRPPDACAVREVIDAASGEQFLTATLPGPLPGEIKAQRLVTLHRVAGPGEKRHLAEQHQATLVDMEAAAVARFARAHNLKFLCFKAVTDGPNDQLPDFNRFITPEGQLRIPSLVAWAVVHPGYWRPLRRLGQNSRLAAQELSNFVSRALSGSVK